MTQTVTWQDKRGEHQAALIGVSPVDAGGRRRLLHLRDGDDNYRVALVQHPTAREGEPPLGDEVYEWVTPPLTVQEGLAFAEGVLSGAADHRVGISAQALVCAAALIGQARQEREAE